jgi:type VI secretion system protein ImpC
MDENLSRTIGNLPMYVFTDDGETKIMPCAEVVATENLLHQILEQGMIPLISSRDSTKIQIARFQPVSQSSTNLIGKWNSGGL